MPVTLKYVNAEELVNILSESQQAQLSDDSAASPPVIDTEMVNTFLAYAESTAETHIQSRYALPLAYPPMAFVYAILAIARHLLFERRDIVSETAERAHDRALAWLEKIQAEDADLFPSSDFPDESEVVYGTSVNPWFDDSFFLGDTYTTLP